METPCVDRINKFIHTHPRKTQDKEYGERPVTFFNLSDRIICGTPLVASSNDPTEPNTSSYKFIFCT